MNNEEAVTYGNELIQCSTGPLREFAELATRALRTPPATGAAAMREAAAKVCSDIYDKRIATSKAAAREGLYGKENDQAMMASGAHACLNAIRALPAPEVPGRTVPEAITNWIKWYDTLPHRHAGSDHEVRDWIRKEYGL